MVEFSTPVRRFAIAAIAFAALLTPLAANAQDVPSYATPQYSASTDETIHGRIASVDGAFSLTVDDDRGFVDSVELHPGTIINPTGLTLAAGMSVTIAGVNAGSTFSANEIDTPYTYAGPLPSPVYYGAGYWYPGFAYGYGPAFCLTVVIAGAGFGAWHYNHVPFYGRPWNGHAYVGAAVGGAPPGARSPVALDRGGYGGVQTGRTAAEPRSGYVPAMPEHEFSLVSSGRTAPARPGGESGYNASGYSGPRGGNSGGAARGGEPHGDTRGGGSHGGESHGGGGHGH